ncbi:guanylate kinase [Rhabdaerophilum sp. SD176]|uniref:guanylate kinase n=1 Tax=Rhabdaerophilum sp. SD176 TaxID=2983548 RepID=UPI0024DF8006|nr:guanylate kinase [Rhabdaerophilum sp. SD176]
MAPGHPSSTQAPLRRGIMFVISSPSGAGKSALSRLLLQDDPEIRLSVSVTTRPRRPSEVHGVHYHFIDVPTFHQMRERGDLLEWAEVHGNFYATPRQLVEQALGEGRDVLFDIDVQGTLQLYECMREDVVSVFILPPSIAELQSRLKRRAEDSDDVILRRLRTAETEIARWQDYDFVLVNDDLERCFHDLKQVLVAERLKRHRQPHLPALTEALLKDLRTVLS